MKPKKEQELDDLKKLRREEKRRRRENMLPDNRGSIRLMERIQASCGEHAQRREKRK